MSTKLHRTFPTRERFVAEFVRRLSERGIELNLPGEQAPPTGTVLHLDLRLDDGTELIVGTGEVTEGGRPGDAFRVRFLELSKQSRTHLGELVVKAASAPSAPSAQRPAPAAGSQSLVALVAETYGDETPPGMTDNSAVMVPPDAVSAAPAAGSGAPAAGARTPAAGPRAPAAGAKTPATGAGAPARPARAPAAPSPPAPAKTGRPPRRTQISPSVIVIAIIAGAAGAAAQAWFDDLADLVWHLRDEPGAVSNTAIIDILPTDVIPSDFSDESEAASEAAQGEQPAPEGDADPLETADPRQADAGPIAEGSPAEGEATPTEGEAAPLELDPANRVRLITWEEGVGATVITLWGNGAFPPDRVSYFEVEGGQPRMLIKLRGIDLPYRETALALETSEVVRLRTGFHPQSPVNELHLVLDLAAPGVGLERIERGESSLSFHLGPNPPSGSDAFAAE